MTRTIKVTGTGKISVIPDVICLIITQQNTFKEYQDVIEGSSKDKASLNSILAEFDFKKTDLKTTSFKVDKDYTYYTDKNGHSKKRFVGYKYIHHMKIQFPFDNDLLGRVLYALSRCSGEPDFSIEYTTSDPQKAKNMLLEKAIENCKLRAEIMAKASGVTLGDILTIDYSWGEVNFVSRPLDTNIIHLMEASPSLDITPDDIDAEDTVTMIWEIK